MKKKKIIKSQILLFGLGFLLSLSIQFFVRDRHESSYFEFLAGRIRQSSRSADDKNAILGALHLSHDLLSKRSVVFGVPASGGDCPEPLSLSDDLVSAKGACGSYSKVLARLLQALGYEVRIPQMKVNNNYGGHIIVEVLTGKGWAVLDPQFDFHFEKPSGDLASFHDVSSDWNFFRRQTPPGYPPTYTYSDARYTDWEKVPVVLPALRKILEGIFGEKRVSEFCIAPWLLRKFRILTIVFSSFTLVLFIIWFPSGLAVQKFRYFARPGKIIRMRLFNNQELAGYNSLCNPYLVAEEMQQKITE